MSVKPVTFRLRPENRSLYCVVHVWPTRSAMMAHLRRIYGKNVAASLEATSAVCNGITAGRYRHGRRRTRGIFAEIECHRERFNSEILVHETTHAAMRWAKRIGLDTTWQNDGVDVSPDEERFASGTGRMAAQFNDAMHKHKLW